MKVHLQIPLYLSISRKSLISPHLEGTRYVVEFIVLGSNQTSAGGDGVKRSMCKVKLAMRRTFWHKPSILYAWNC